MPQPVVALDADVLVPIVACDFLLTAFEYGLFEPVVSTTALDEVERALLTDFPHLDPAAVRYRAEAMRDVLDDHLVVGDPTNVPEEVNAKDRHVVAAAMTGEATILVTNDGQLRDEVGRALPGLRAIGLDGFAVDLLHRSPEAIAAVVDALVAKRTRPPITSEDLLRAMQNMVPTFTDHVRRSSPG